MNKILDLSAELARPKDRRHDRGSKLQKRLRGKKKNKKEEKEEDSDLKTFNTKFEKDMGL